MADKAKEIIFVTLHLTDGGAERVTSELTNEWIRQGHKVIIVQLVPDMFTNSYAMSDKVEYINFPHESNKALRNLNWVRDMIRILKEHPNATALSFAKTTIYVLGLAEPFVKNRIVMSERNDPYTTPKTWMRRQIRDRAFERADACVLQTTGARDYFPKKVRRKSVVIPNPISATLPEPYEGVRDKRIIAAGRLHPQKNFPMLIRAFAMLHNDFPDYQLVIYGRGALEEELRKLADSLGVGDFVSLPGFTDQLYEEMRTCALYVSSSDYEGMSNSMLEALAMGVPSVVTDCPSGGAKAVIRNNENGILVPVGDAQKMYEGMKKVLSDPAFAEKISKESAKLKDKLSVEKIAAKWLRVL